MKIKAEHIAPCGLYCGVCGVYYATRENNQKFLERLVTMYQNSFAGMDDLKIDVARKKGLKDAMNARNSPANS